MPHSQRASLSKSFYHQPTIDLAQALLGCILVKETTEGVTSGVIVETEAYLGATDRAAHGFKNRRTKRTEIMFGEPGHAYTHLMHTHCLINVVSGEINQPESVLIRALEPYEGIDLMLKRRPVNKLQNLTSGPGKLTKAMGIDMNDYGHSFLYPPLFITEGNKKPPHIATGTRIGIDNSGEAKDYPLRFWVAGNKFVSR
ncbi:DNA-3-methyladenine glycosylase [Virgibacillus sp. 179-BFC.A HS]|uniref:Putative 3-methyladenine DNA glycosylase n=1 Tax=Tigheibacillus jepli TaxID=3035914 RepID=A0ABU5CKT8_9BACI|nr:DNA-3-methyladenine glycosylase [Virgibacillus sp. 179-BFC.A HS]MDY0406452.1 DNA-3-methyladenine glycosylase [Virgibacillus sp. 179-BFC.A HS]